VLVFVSGGSALVYQSLWLRSFGLVFGNTTDAVAMVLAVFMGGLGVGSLLAARRPAAAPLRAYARVEMGIGATALLTLPLLTALPAAYAALAGGLGLAGPAEAVGRALLAALVLLPTTVLLGATVPLAVEFLDRSGAGFQASLGRVYLVNTLGAAAGVFLGAFVLVPTLGVSRSLVAAALANLLVGAVAWRWSQETAASPPAARPASRPRLPPPFAILAAASGAFTFGIEVLWTRSFALVIGSSTYAFSLMLLAVLLGLVAGTAIYGRLRHRVSRPAAALGILFLGAGLAALAGALVIGRLPAAYLALMRELPVTFTAHQLAGFALCLLAMLPVTTVLGVTFPLLAHLVDRDTCSAQEASGRLYVWNTAGAILGALATDVLLVEALGLQTSYLALAGLPLAAGAWTLAGAASRRPALRAASVLLAVAAVVGLLPWWRPWDPLTMTSGVHRYGIEWASRPGFHLGELAAQRRLLFYREGREAVVAVSEPADSPRRFLSINGKTDAGGGAEDVLQQKFVAHVPLLLHPSPRRVLVIGWGSGATAASATLYPVERLECVEIEPATWEAAPLFDSLSGRVRADPRFRIVFRDARNHLLRSPERWDVIASEPSNAWIAGVANLFTREFYQVARDRLAPGGVFAQWFHYYNLEPADVKVELATFAAVFPHVSVWAVPPLPPEDGGTLSADLLLVGSLEPRVLDWPRLSRAFRETPVGEDLRATRVVQDELTLLASHSFGRDDLLRLTEDRGLFPRGVPLNTDDRPWIEFRAARHVVLPPGQVRRLAQQLHVTLGEAAADPMPPLTGHPGLAGGGRGAAALHAALADRWSRIGLPGRARRALERALVLDPECEPALDRLGGEAIDLQDWPRAEALHRGLLRVRPGDVDAWLRLAAVLTRQAKWTEARDALRRARSLDPKAPVAPELMAFVERQAASAAASPR
jgi:spermidine synthase